MCRKLTAIVLNRVAFKEFFIRKLCFKSNSYARTKHEKHYTDVCICRLMFFLSSAVYKFKKKHKLFIRLCAFVLLFYIFGASRERFMFVWGIFVICGVAHLQSTLEKPHRVHCTLLSSYSFFACLFYELI
jgi:hypothetical protein